MDGELLDTGAIAMNGEDICEGVAMDGVDECRVKRECSAVLWEDLARALAKSVVKFDTSRSEE